MTTPAADSLLAAFAGLTDPRHRRGVRHPFSGLLALTFLGLLCRQGDFAAIARWARRHWPELAGPLGFTRGDAPHATTLSRAAALYSVAEFQAAGADPLALGVPAEWLARSDNKQVPRTVEGFLFPAAYDIQPGATASSILKMMVTKFLSVVDEIDFVEAVTAARGTTIPHATLTPYDALIVASIAQAEVRHENEMGMAARAMYNRLYSNVPGIGDLGTRRVLELDASINYSFKLQGNPSLDPADFKASVLNDPNNPYNTYEQPGMPISPLTRAARPGCSSRFFARRRAARSAGVRSMDQL